MRIKDVDSDILLKEINSLFTGSSILKLVQIGSNDGFDHDPVYDLVINNRNINGCFIEPQKESFCRLRKTYEILKDQNRCVFLNYAISITDGPIKLYKNIDRDGNDKHSSLLLRNNALGGRFEEDKYEIVDGITFNTFLSLLKKNGYGNKIDVMIIDTEGFDCTIINQSIECNCLPKIFFFEVPNMVLNDDRLCIIQNGISYFNETITNLQNIGYKIKQLKGNIIAIL